MRVYKIIYTDPFVGISSLLIVNNMRNLSLTGKLI